MADIHMDGQKQKTEPIILVAPQSAFAGFVEFLRERGVAGFAIGFIFGGAAQVFVKSLMDDIINPMIGLFLGPVGGLSDYTIGVFRVGNFFSALVNFFILCFIIYFIFKVLRLEKLDKPRE
ncbi:MAG TPA: MscL family protein [Candidatus Paceibacterota bacterium]